jgi:hypothetical protein
MSNCCVARSPQPFEQNPVQPTWRTSSRQITLNHVKVRARQARGIEKELERTDRKREFELESPLTAGQNEDKSIPTACDNGQSLRKKRINSGNLQARGC